MGLYRGVLEERRGEPLPVRRGLYFEVLVRRLEVSQGCPRYAVDSSMMRRLISRGPRNAGEGMRLGSLKAKYPKEYADLRAGQQGQRELY